MDQALKPVIHSLPTHVTPDTPLCSSVFVLYPLLPDTIHLLLMHHVCLLLTDSSYYNTNSVRQDFVVLFCTLICLSLKLWLAFSK
jgi:hypothetical protein